VLLAGCLVNDFCTDWLVDEWNAPFSQSCRLWEAAVRHTLPVREGPMPVTLHELLPDLPAACFTPHWRALQSSLILATTSTSDAHCSYTFTPQPHSSADSRPTTNHSDLQRLRKPTPADLSILKRFCTHAKARPHCGAELPPRNRVPTASLNRC
jgi:hypothetical protein